MATTKKKTKYSEEDYKNPFTAPLNIKNVTLPKKAVKTSKKKGK